MRIVVYTLPVCSNCKLLKGLLEKKGVEFIEMDMKCPEAMTELYMAGVYPLAAPVLQIDKSFYINLNLPGGINEILDKHEITGRKL